MHIPVITEIPANHFRRISTSIGNTKPLDTMSNVMVREFLTKDGFWIPHDTNFITTKVTEDGKTLRIYSWNNSKTVITLSYSLGGNFVHRIYTTTNVTGFYLKEVFELVDHISR